VALNKEQKILAEKNIGLIGGFCKRQGIQLSALRNHDLHGVLNLAYVKAIQAYKPELGKLSTFIYQKLKWAYHSFGKRLGKEVLQELPGPDRLPDRELGNLAVDYMGQAIGDRGPAERAYRQEPDELGMLGERFATRLTQREKQITELHYRAGLSFTEIGVRLGLTKQRICQINARALEKLKC